MSIIFEKNSGIILINKKEEQIGKGNHPPPTPIYRSLKSRKLSLQAVQSTQSKSISELCNCPTGQLALVRSYQTQGVVKGVTPLRSFGTFGQAKVHIPKVKIKATVKSERNLTIQAIINN